MGEYWDGILKIVRNITLSHHEKWYGFEYQFGLKGEKICPEGRIVGIADKLDALTSERPYGT